MGYKRSGKDSLAARLVNAHGWARYAFADPMRAMLESLDPIVTLGGQRLRLSDVLAMHSGWDGAKERLPEVRRLMQALGTEAGRAILGEDVWVTTTMREVDRTPGPVVVTDVRFPNEAQAVVDRGGVLVRVLRPTLRRDDPHPSENSVDDVGADYTVVNDGTLDDLQAVADLIADDLTASP